MASAVALAMRVEQTVSDLVEQGQVQLALGIEVLVEHRLGHPGGVGDVVHRRAVVPWRGEDLERDVEQLFPSGGGGQSRRT